jgi:hypothetical protein
VYNVKREDGIGKHRTLHQNLLLPISSLPVPFQEQKTKTNKQEIPETPKQKDSPQDITVSEATQEETEESEPEETEEENGLVWIETLSQERDKDTLSKGHRIEKEQGDIDSIVSKEDTDSSVSLSKDTVSVDNKEGTDSSVSENEGAMSIARREDDSTVLQDDNDKQEAAVEEFNQQTSLKKPIPKPRRSARVRKPPAWMTDGTYVVSQVVQPQVDTSSNWDMAERSRILRLLATEEVFSKVPQKVAEAIWRNIVE